MVFRFERLQVTINIGKQIYSVISGSVSDPSHVRPVRIHGSGDGRLARPGLGKHDHLRTVSGTRVTGGRLVDVEGWVVETVRA